MAKKNLYLPDERAKHIWRAWEKMAEQLTPPNPSGYTMKPSTLIALIGEAAINDHRKTAELMRHIIGLEEE